MDTLSLIKQPEPSVLNSSNKTAAETKDKADNEKKEKRQIVRPKVGVVNVENISTTPITDTLEIRKQENPFTKYKLSNNNKAKFSYKEIASLIIVAIGIGSIFGLKK